MSCRYNLSIRRRVLSVTVLLAFSLQQLAFANPDMRSLDWSLFGRPAFALTIPEHIATIKESHHLAASDKTIYLIQDAHTNESAQRNLAKTLEIILSEEGISYVFTEAAIGDNSLSFLKKYGTPELRARVGLSFLRKGELKGSEYLSMTSKHDFKLWGVEDKDLYMQSIKSYQTIRDKRKNIQAYLKKIEITLNALKPKLLNRELLKIDHIYRTQDKSLTEYASYLIQKARQYDLTLIPQSHLVFLDALQKSEQKINFEQASLEQSQAIETLSLRDREQIFNHTPNNPHKLNSQVNARPHAFYLALKDKIKDLSKYPQLSIYLDYLEASKRIKPELILEEISKLEDMLFKTLAKTPDELDLIQYSRNLTLLQNLFNLKITPSEFAQLNKTPENFSILQIAGFLNRKIMDAKSLYERALFMSDEYETIYQEAINFYQLTRKRDQFFLDSIHEVMNQKNLKKAVFISGGYHTPHLKARLKQEYISFHVITPDRI